MKSDKDALEINKTLSLRPEKHVKIVFTHGIYRSFTRGVVLKQLNYPISMLPILFRSDDRFVNAH